MTIMKMMMMLMMKMWQPCRRVSVCESGVGAGKEIRVLPSVLISRMKSRRSLKNKQLQMLLNNINIYSTMKHYEFLFVN